jgi:exodeoxyribonuclease V alpha subunit
MVLRRGGPGSGRQHDSPQRVKAGLQFALSEASEDGHCYLPETELVTKATGLLEVEDELAGRCLEELIAEEGVVAEPLTTAPESPIDQQAPRDRAIWLVPFHRAEVALAGGLLRLLQAPADRLASFQAVDWPVPLDWLRQRTGVTLAPEQEEAVRLALTQRVAVLTGGPGCGKSYTIRAVVTLARAKHAKIMLAAPTGRAAKRLGELAGLEAATLHRLLQLRPGGDAAFDRDHPLDADLVVVDEASMLDVLLANKLVKAIPRSLISRSPAMLGQHQRQVVVQAAPRMLQQPGNQPVQGSAQRERGTHRLHLAVQRKWPPVGRPRLDQSVGVLDEVGCIDGLRHAGWAGR